jgi:hypothetical protein
MTRLREEFDADREHRRFSEAPTAVKSREVTCSECGRPSFCDRYEYDRLMREFDADADNQFVCDHCIEISEQLEH